MLAAVFGLGALLAIVSPMLTLSRSIPQVVRVMRAGAAGVSSTTWMLQFVVAELWAAYGVLARVPAEVVTNVPAAALALCVVLLAASHRGSLGSALAGAGGLSLIAALFVGACVLAHAEGIEAAVAVSGSLSFYLPQLFRAFGQRDLSGVSSLSWSLAFLASVSWGIYGLLIHKVPVYLPSVVMAPAALIITVRAGMGRPKATLLP